ncbi:MAG: hypothetical protein PHG00_03480 [Methylococcales bacterium]|nr:hypothetical protein [Methylococcales bacterium]
MSVNRFQLQPGLTISEFLAVDLISQAGIGLPVSILKRHFSSWFVQRKLKNVLFGCKAVLNAHKPDFGPLRSCDDHD